MRLAILADDDHERLLVLGDQRAGRHLDEAGCGDQQRRVDETAGDEAPFGVVELDLGTQGAGAGVELAGGTGDLAAHLALWRRGVDHIDVEPDLDDRRLGLLRVDGDLELRGIGDGHQRQCGRLVAGGVGDQCALIRVARRDHPRERRAQRAIARQGADLGDLRLGNAHVGIGGVECLLREETRAREFARALGDLPLVGEAGIDGGDLRIEFRRGDLGDHLTLLDDVAHVDVDATQIAAHLAVERDALVRQSLADQGDFAKVRTLLRFGDGDVDPGRRLLGLLACLARLARLARLGVIEHAAAGRHDQDDADDEEYDEGTTLALH